jgi:hypothetical protein
MISTMDHFISKILLIELEFTLQFEITTKRYIFNVLISSVTLKSRGLSLNDIQNFYKKLKLVD